MEKTLQFVIPALMGVESTVAYVKTNAPAKYSLSSAAIAKALSRL